MMTSDLFALLSRRKTGRLPSSRGPSASWVPSTPSNCGKVKLSVSQITHGSVIYHKAHA